MGRVPAQLGGSLALAGEELELTADETTLARFYPTHIAGFGRAFVTFVPSLFKITKFAGRTVPHHR